MSATFRFGTAGLLLLASLAAFVVRLARPMRGRSPSSTARGRAKATSPPPADCASACVAARHTSPAKVAITFACSLRCASDSYNFDLAGDVDHRNGAISGSWTEASRKASGTISGRVNGDQIEANAKGDTFSVNLSLTTRGNRQAVTIQSLAAEVTNVTVTLNK